MEKIKCLDDTLEEQQYIMHMRVLKLVFRLEISGTGNIIHILIILELPVFVSMWQL